MPAVGGIAKGAEVGVVRCDQEEAAAGSAQAMKLFHGADDVGDVLDDVDRAECVEGVVAERVRKTVEVAQHVGATARIAIDADGAGILVDAAAHVEGRPDASGGGFARRIYSTSFRHSSSVSTAKSA